MGVFQRRRGGRKTDGGVPFINHLLTAAISASNDQKDEYQ